VGCGITILVRKEESVQIFIGTEGGERSCSKKTQSYLRVVGEKKTGKRGYR